MENVVSVESEHSSPLCNWATAQMKSSISRQALPQQTMCSVTAFLLREGQGYTYTHTLV